MENYAFTENTGGTNKRVKTCSVGASFSLFDIGTLF